MRILPVGLTGWLVEAETGDAAAALYAYLRERSLPQVADLVPGARSVLLDSAGLTEAALREALSGFSPDVAPDFFGEAVEIPVRYDGEDLDDVARWAGCSPAEVTALHTGSDLRVAFCGFSPGFAYLTGVPERLHVPRLSRPRTAVDAGSVAVAGGYTAVYPRRSPGGWRILGHTSVRLWDERRTPPALLTPGTRVRFVAAS
ncbi:MAG: allophanate hydrolase subunit 1 [Hamadaea sp.]|uniref:5-oxoprolinase subunit B family protein n=1 Tax=Hamadaea sp. TaxID=2024425 RepID=UPI00179BCD9B|nr:allophanate hydrolase subunit 1 [Hamadaea sp.]NUR73316.1 allophanate hydrolase subunit 1 [Hamadaea sp.]NUT21505.1 allophanate hydrolase subunit 1 [Hamadaea sp.]